MVAAQYVELEWNRLPVDRDPLERRGWLGRMEIASSHGESSGLLVRDPYPFKVGGMIGWP
jgi:hypothetical protein